MKQTAVEWLFNEYVKKSCITIAMIEQAKEMEKEQICDAFYYGVDVDSFCVKSPYRAAEQYYNETFKSE